jgi:protein-disulfide isomerase
MARRGNVTALWSLALLIAVGSAMATSAAAAGQPLAQVDGVAITAEEVDKALAAELSKLHEQIYELRRQKVEALIAERLLATEAAKRGISVPALVDAEVTPKVRVVTEQEVDTFYKANKARLKGTEASLREQIRTHLQKQKLSAQRDVFIHSLRAQATVVVLLESPPPLRIPISVDGAPFKGSATAPVTIVKFEDFQCPFCKQVQPTFDQLLSRYGDKVRLVHRDFPIDSLHPQARQAAEAARCATDQGKFWAYHDILYANAPKAGPDQLKTYARELGLDLPAFDQCLTSGKHQAAVQKDIEEGTRAGVTGTPAFFIDGRFISGAQPLENLVRVVDDELTRVK